MQSGPGGRNSVGLGLEGGMRGRGEAEKVGGPGLGFECGQGVEGNQRDREGW